ncbi:MAG: hypothetical protein NXI23_02475 [Bacteroidetes bacterium]|jgi:flagellar basal body-associated protein FliL|nr:hypothetical protein [Bacteroidota bacterium]MDF1863898.1 hypothetical protein [Saprospiraceae bacterium]
MRKKLKKKKINQPNKSVDKNNKSEWITILIIVLLALLGLISSFLFFKQSAG